jgi:hypothetical protein
MGFLDRPHTYMHTCIHCTPTYKYMYSYLRCNNISLSQDLSLSSLSHTFLGSSFSNDVQSATLSGPRRLVACLRYAVDDVVVRLATVDIYLTGTSMFTIHGRPWYYYLCSWDDHRILLLSRRHKDEFDIRKALIPPQAWLYGSIVLQIAFETIPQTSMDLRNGVLEPVHKCQSSIIMIAPTSMAWHRCYLMVFPSNWRETSMNLLESFVRSNAVATRPIDRLWLCN